MDEKDILERRKKELEEEFEKSNICKRYCRSYYNYLILGCIGMLAPFISIMNGTEEELFGFICNIIALVSGVFFCYWLIYGMVRLSRIQNEYVNSRLYKNN